MKNAPAHTELHAEWVAFGRNPNEMSYALREGRNFADSSGEIFEVFSGGQLENPVKIKRQFF